MPKPNSEARVIAKRVKERGGIQGTLRELKSGLGFDHMRGTTFSAALKTIRHAGVNCREITPGIFELTSR